MEVEDIKTVSETNLSMTEGITDTIYAFADFEDLTGINPTFSGVPELIKLTRPFIAKPNLGAIIVYGTDHKLIKFFGSIVLQVGKKDWRIFDTREEAIRHLIHIDLSYTSELEQLLSSVVDD